MSGLAVTLLLIAGIAWVLVSATLLALLKAAALGDARLELEFTSPEDHDEPRHAASEPIALERPTGRFTRRGTLVAESEDQPLAR